MLSKIFPNLFFVQVSIQSRNKAFRISIQIFFQAFKSFEIFIAWGQDLQWEQRVDSDDLSSMKHTVVHCNRSWLGTYCQDICLTSPFALIVPVNRYLHDIFCSVHSQAIHFWTDRLKSKLWLLWGFNNCLLPGDWFFIVIMERLLLLTIYKTCYILWYNTVNYEHSITKFSTELKENWTQSTATILLYVRCFCFFTGNLFFPNQQSDLLLVVYVLQCLVFPTKTRWMYKIQF